MVIAPKSHIAKGGYMPFKLMASYTLLTVFSYVFQFETRKSVGCVFHEMPSFLCDCLFSVIISTVKKYSV